jgi:hypothetical protein
MLLLSGEGLEFEFVVGMIERASAVRQKVETIYESLPPTADRGGFYKGILETEEDWLEDYYDPYNGFS